MDTRMLQASPDSEADPLTLIDITLDLQIIICTLLHPSDILALRATCKTLKFLTRKRAVWVDALHRVCLDNSLFLPSFPIPEMSDLELEHAAMAPRRWIELCSSLQKRYPTGSWELYPRTVRVIEDYSFGAGDQPQIFIVPGGRYMMSGSHNGIFIWDLGYTSNAHIKLLASVGREGGSNDWMVRTTPDGMGLVIYSSRRFSRYEDDCSVTVYEIYPQSETPRLTQIAHLDLNSNRSPGTCLLPDRVLLYYFHDDRIVFRVWDYRIDHSISFSADVDLVKFGFNIQVIPMQTAIVVLCEEEILVWAIPPLSPQLPDFSDHNPIHIPSLFKIALPDGIVNGSNLVGWQTTSYWYIGSSQPLYFDIVRRDSTLHRFEIIIKPDLLDASLHTINTEVFPDDLYKVFFQKYSICEDTLVACWNSIIYPEFQQWKIYTGSISSHPTTVISQGGPAVKMLLPTTIGSPSRETIFLCPSSGRFVHVDKDTRRLVVMDLL